MIPSLPLEGKKGGKGKKGREEKEGRTEKEEKKEIKKEVSKLKPEQEKTGEQVERVQLP